MSSLTDTEVRQIIFKEFTTFEVVAVPQDLRFTRDHLAAARLGVLEDFPEELDDNDDTLVDEFVATTQSIAMVDLAAKLPTLSTPDRERLFVQYIAGAYIVEVPPVE